MDPLEMLCTEAEQAHQGYLKAQSLESEKAKMIKELDNMIRVLNIASKYFGNGGENHNV